MRTPTPLQTEGYKGWLRKTPRGRMNCVHHVRIRSKVEANVAPSEVLEALKQQIFNLEITLQVQHLLAVL